MERQKVVRKIRTTRAQISSIKDAENLNELKSKEMQLLDDLCYIMYFPKDMKYIGLFSNKDESNNNPKTLAKTNSLQDRARKLAQASRTQELEQGMDDRVVQAIESVNSTSKPNNLSTSSNSSPFRDDSKSLSKKRKVSSVDDEPMESPSVTLKSLRTKDSSDEATPHTVEKSQKTKSDKLKDKKNITLQHIDDSLAAVQTEFDPFFVDESIESTITTVTEKGFKVPQYKVSIGDIRKHASSKNDHNRKTVIENDGTMNKQELRLLNWQMKVRGRKV